MTVEEIRENLLQVLITTVKCYSGVRNNDTPFPGDQTAHSLAIEAQSRQITTAKICCKAAGIDEETIRNIVSLHAL